MNDILPANATEKAAASGSGFFIFRPLSEVCLGELLCTPAQIL